MLNLVQHASWKQQGGRSRRISRLSGFKDVSQGLSVSWPSSHDRKSVFSHGGPTATENTPHHTTSTTTTSPAHLHVLFPPQRILKWHSWFTLHHWDHHKQKQQSAVFHRVSPLSENWTGTSAHHALICPRIIPYRCTGSVIYSSIFTTLSRFINFSHGTSSRLRTAVCRKPCPPKTFIRKYSLVSSFHNSCTNLIPAL